MMTEMVTAAEVERSIFFVEGLATAEDRAEMRHWQALADLAAAAGSAADVAAYREMVVVICQSVYIREQLAAARARSAEMTDKEWAADQAQAIAAFNSVFDEAGVLCWAAKIHPCLAPETRQELERGDAQIRDVRAQVEEIADRSPGVATAAYLDAGQTAASIRDSMMRMLIQQREICTCTPAAGEPQ